MIRPDLFTLDQILNKKLFEIPKFQRPYSWKKAQRADLFSDISALLIGRNANAHHFMATIVCLKDGKKKSGSNTYERMQIVDGQQRLTTLIILLKAIQIDLSNSSLQSDLAEAEELQKILVRGQRLVLLQTNHQSARMFRSYLISSSIPDIMQQETVAERDVAQAIKECQEFIIQTKNSGTSVVSLLDTIKNRLDFIFYTIDDEKAVYTVFEVLNSRGLPVASLDKCKSMLMGVAFEKYRTVAERNEVINALHEVWESIYQTIGKAEIRDYELLRYAATLCYDNNKGKPLSEEESLKFFEEISKKQSRPDNLPAVLKQSEDICLLISKVIKDVADQLTAFAKDVRKSNAVTDITQARLLSVAIGMSAYSQSEKDTLSALWEKITFRIYALHNKDSRNCVGDYVRLARSIFYGLSYNQAIIDLNNIGAYYPVETAVAELKGKPWYPEHNDELKYVLFRYEEHLSAITGAQLSSQVWNQIWSDNPYKTIEHIYPKTFSPELQANWPNPNVKNQDDLDKFVHNIGNLTLLPPGMNSSLGQSSFIDKKNEYVTLGMRINQDIVNKNNWSESDIQNREQEILNFILSEWA